jgi:hypothetical protein
VKNNRGRPPGNALLSSLCSVIQRQGTGKPKTDKAEQTNNTAAHSAPLPAPIIATAASAAQTPQKGCLEAEPLQAVSESLPQGNKDVVPLLIRFSHEENQQFLQAIEGKKLSPGLLSDLYLHRQALDLSLSPGFDALLSLPVVQNLSHLIIR